MRTLDCMTGLLQRLQISLWYQHTPLQPVKQLRQQSKLTDVDTVLYITPTDSKAALTSTRNGAREMSLCRTLYPSMASADESEVVPVLPWYSSAESLMNLKWRVLTQTDAKHLVRLRLRVHVA